MLGYGLFITVTVNFLIVAAVLFFVVKAMNRVKKPEAPKPTEVPPLLNNLCREQAIRTFPHLTFAGKAKSRNCRTFYLVVSGHNEEVIAMRINLLPLEIILGLQGAASIIIFLMLMKDNPSTKD